MLGPIFQLTNKYLGLACPQMQMNAKTSQLASLLIFNRVKALPFAELWILFKFLLKLSMDPLQKGELLAYGLVNLCKFLLSLF